MAGPGTIQIGRLSRFFTKWLGTKGQSIPMTMGSEVVPALPLWSGVENRALESWQTFFVAINVAAAAANQSCFRIRNPAGSNVIAVIIKLAYGSFALDTSGGFRIGNASTDLNSGASNGGLDTRAQTNATCVLSSQNTTVSAPALTGINQAFWGAVQPANTLVDVINTENQEIPLLPGLAIQGVVGVVNQQGLFTIMWRERALEDSERT